MPENGQEKKKVINALLVSFSSLVFSTSPGGLKNRRYEKKKLEGKPHLAEDVISKKKAIIKTQKGWERKDIYH